MEKAESFEVQEYDPEDLPVAEKLSVIKQILDDRKNDPSTAGLPSFAFQIALQGDQLITKYHCYEMLLSSPDRLKEVERQADASLTELLKYLKKEFKSRTKKALTLKERKELRNYSVTKVSLNERYYYVSWRVYEMGLPVR